MTEETTFSTEETTFPTESTTAPTESVPVTEPPGDDTGEPVPLETIPGETLEIEWTEPESIFTESTETTETVEVVETVDYVQVIENSTGILVNVILCAALIIVGFFSALKFWGPY